MVKLPDEFLEWNYYARRKLLEKVARREPLSPETMYLVAARHNPVLCTAAPRDDGTVEVNGKVVGVGYVVKRDRLSEVIKALKEHVKAMDERYEELKRDEEELRKALQEYSVKGAKLLLEYVYLPPERATKEVDFEKLATVELAKRLPHSSKHTWGILQRSRKACLVFFQPPLISFEVRSTITIHEGDEYHEYVTLVHDAFHYTPLERRADRPVYIFHVEEVYDNSPTPRGFGRRIA